MQNARMTPPRTEPADALDPQVAAAQRTAPAPRVVAVAGPPGSGKSTLVRALAAEFGGASVLSMDHYQRMTEAPIGEIADWWARGADHDELPVPLLAAHLAALRRGEPVVDPATGETIGPAPLILFETHFGRAHRETGPLIDLLLWLDTPPDVALARVLRGFVAPLLRPGAEGAAVADELRWIDGYLANYLQLVSGLVRLQAERVRPGADLRVTAGAPVSAVAAELRRLIASQ